jgi:hypothetical protein
MLWFCGRGIWVIVFWSFVFGDAGPYEEYGRWVAAIVALLVAATILVRLSWGFASRRYLRICFGGTIALAVVFGVMSAQEFASRIYGWSARGAAENYLARVRGENQPFIDPSAPRRVVEVDMPIWVQNPLWVQNPRPLRRFVLCFGNTPTLEVRVAPYGWWWWTMAGSGPYPLIDLDWAAEHWNTHREEATERLNAIITNYPNTEAAEWASATLTSLREKRGPVASPWMSKRLKILQEELSRRRKAGTGSR